MVSNKLKEIGYILAIVILFIPAVQLGLSTFVDSPDEPEYRSCYIKEIGEVNEACEAEHELIWEEYRKEKGDSDVLKFIIVSIVGLVTILATIFATLQPTVKYGLFTGAVVNEFVSFLMFNIKKSMIGLVLLVVLFILVVWFINKDEKN